MNAVAVSMPVLVGLISTALLFDFLNGLHDSANSIATVVATRVLRPFTAVLWAAFFNFIAFTVFGLHVAATISSGVIDAGIVGQGWSVGSRLAWARNVGSAIVLSPLTG